MDLNLEDLTDDEDFIFVVRNTVYERSERVFRERINQFNEWSDEEFLKRFRLSKNTVLFIVEQIRNNISPLASNKNHALSAEEKVLITLRFLATGSFLKVAGDFIGVHESTTSRLVYKVCTEIARMAPRFINFPENPEEIRQVASRFYKISRFPRCVGAVDCTHIKIQSPGGNNPEDFRNRKGYFSYNVQVVCDANLKIEDIVCRWPGSTHDATIFKNSSVRTKFENGQMGDSLLFGDSGYGIKKYLITPLANPQSPLENIFNESQIRTRNPIERCFGVLKRRFPILFFGIRLQHIKVEAVVVACAVLHNIAAELNDNLPPLNSELEELFESHTAQDNSGNENIVDNRGGINNVVRHALIYGHFRRLL